MSHRLSNIASAASLVLLIAVLALWVRSYRIGEGFSKDGIREGIEISSQTGSLLYYHQVNPPLFPGDTPEAPAKWSYSSFREFSPLDVDDGHWFNRLGISVEWRDRIPAMVFSERPMFQTITRIVIPYWVVAIPLAILPMLRSAGLIRRKLHDRQLRG